MAYDDGELRGIGGWLAFFLVTLGVFTPLSTLYAVGSLSADAVIAANYGPLWGRLMALEWTLSALSMAAGWVAVWHFFKVRQWRTVRLTVTVLWLLAFLAIVGEPLGVSLVTGLSFGDLFATAPAEFARPFIYSTIWTLYLLQSERVANTYPVDGTGDAIVEVFE